MSRPYIKTVVLFSLTLLFAPQTRADGPFRYPEATHGKGQLKYINGVPVLLLRGTPEEVGEQLGVLALKPAHGFIKKGDEFLKRWEPISSIVLKHGNVLLPQVPRDHLKELDAAAKASGLSRNLLVFGNTISDLRKMSRCSALLVEPDRSATGGVLFGRNMDWADFGRLHEYTLVAVYRPKRKRAFAMVTYPGLIGCVSGINEAGLALASLDVNRSKDGSALFNPRGTASNLALRRVLEECTSIKEADKLLRSMKRATMLNVAICDKKRCAVFEITPKSLVVRKATKGICACTNHFRTKELATFREDGVKTPRFEALETSRKLKKLTLADVAKKMHAVNQGAATIQTMVFEPTALKLHVAFGKGPATRLPLRTLALSDLFHKRAGSKSTR
jgi:isopenicillin-N N-acyltransferase-like protein